MDSFTPFPALAEEDSAACARFIWPVDTSALPTELLALSWACLLHSFTAEESPVFLLNGSPIKVDLFTRSVNPATPEALPNPSTKRTAVIVEDVEALYTSLCSDLTWIWDPISKSSSLHSKTGLDSANLHRLDSQLKQIVQQQASTSGIQVNLLASEFSLPAMSILNPSPCVLPGPQLLHILALGRAQDSSYAIEYLAADGNIHCLSYESLDRLSSRLATKIVAHAPNNLHHDAQAMVVPVLLPQSLELYITWLAILKAGGAFCPLNIDAPSERIEFILQDVAASVVITQVTLADRVPRNERYTVLFAEGLEVNDEEEIMEPSVNISPADLAYVMYTSGSTGRPKGVAVSHLAATQSLLAHNDLIPPFNRFLQFASPTFDVSVFEVFFPLMRGATLIGSDREQLLLDISRVMTRMDVDAAELTPTVAGELLRTRAAAPALRVLLTIGEMLTRHVVEEFGQSGNYPGILHGMYGPTEAAIHCTAAKDFPSSAGVNLIGKPFKTVSAYIMPLPSDEKPYSQEVQALPLGETGELVVGGLQLANGYINRPEENEKAFIESSVYGRLYRTGDKARMLPSGEIECFGRISSGQVKLRGQRIELGEIEHAICRAPDVRSAVAIVSGGSLAAFVLASGKGITDRELRDICRQWLPRYMVPGEFIRVNQFPQLPSGKVDRKALEDEFVRHWNAAHSIDRQQFRDETEEMLSTLVANVLGRRLSSNESLASAGLDSLAAIQLTSHLLDAGMRLDVTQLLEADSINGVWQLVKDFEMNPIVEDVEADLYIIRQLISEAGAARVESMGLISQLAKIEPCSHIQNAMILETARNSRAYCNWIEIKLQRSTDLALIQGALSQLLERNELLRSGFVEIGLKDHPYARAIWKSFDKCLIQECEHFDYDISLVNENDLLHPFRVQLKSTEESNRMLIHIHHSLYDGWSWQLILSDFHRLLRNEELQPRPAYNLITDHLIQYSLGESPRESLNFWRDQLQGFSAVEFPDFHGKTGLPSGTQKAIRVLDISVSKINNVCQHLKISRQTILQAAYCYILSSYTGFKDVIFGTVFSGRTLPVKGIEAVLGPCIRTLPTRIDFQKMETVIDLLLAIQYMNRKSLEHGSISLQDIKKVSGIGMDQKLFDTAVVWQETLWSNEAQDLLFEEVDCAEFLEFVLLLEFEPKHDMIHAKVTYQESRLPWEQANILLEQIDYVASALLENLPSSMNDISGHLPLSILSASNLEYETQTNDSSLVSGIESVACVEPNRIAIQHLPSLNEDAIAARNQKITYGQLNSQANRLAHYLLQIGVKPRNLIGIFFDVSIEYYISLLAIAKIGAGLLPLMPWNSPRFNSSALADACVQFCIVHSSAASIDAPDIVISTPRIHFPDSLEDYPGDNITTTHDLFYIVCAQEVSSKDAPTTQAYLSYHNLQSHFKALADLYPAMTGSKLLHSFNPTSAEFIIESLFAWHCGMTLCSASDAILPKNISQVINTLSVTHLHLTPSLASLLTPEQVPSVRHLLTSGERLNVKVQQDWAGMGLNYGYISPGTSGVRMICAHSETSRYLSNIGKPLANTSAMILPDEDPFTMLLRGGIGKLFLGGDQVGRNLPGSKPRSVEGFVDHPQFGRLCKTKDFGRLLPDGSITILSGRERTYMQGQATALDEIDRALISSDFVENSVSMAMDEAETLSKQLASIWIPSAKARESFRSGGYDLATENLFRVLSSKLPPMKIPSLLVPMEQLPLNESQRTDSKRIRQEIEHTMADEVKRFSRASTAEQSRKDLTDVEKTIASALSAVTGVDEQNICKETSFFRLGMDSLSAISLSRKLQESGCGRLAVSTILQHSSISQLAAHVTPLANEHSTASTACSISSNFRFPDRFIEEVRNEYNLGIANCQGIYPCTPLQEAMLAAHADVESAYFNHLLFRVKMDDQTMKAAWLKMLLRHDVLRTCFRSTNQKKCAYAQIVLSKADLPWSSVNTADDLRHNIQKRKLVFESQSPVNGKLPYSLTMFTDTTAHEKHLLLSIHHALYDAEGISQLLNELQNVLAGQELPEVTPFHRFINYMFSHNPDTSDQFWDRYLSGAAPILLSKSGRPRRPVEQLGQINCHLDHSLETFRKKCKELSATTLNVIHTAWARLLALYTGSSDVCFGNVFSCRTIPLVGVERIVGPCFNTLPMRVRFSPTATSAEIVKLSQKHNADILPHQLSSLRRIQSRALSGMSPLFDTLVVLQTRSTELDGRYWELLEDKGSMGFPLVCEVVPDEAHDRLSITIHFQKSHVALSAAKQLTQCFVALLQHTLQYPLAQALDKKPIETHIPQLFENTQAKPRGSYQTSSKPPKFREWSHEEEIVRDILCRFSEFDPKAVLPDTTIFHLGLDSINSVQISGELRRVGYMVSSGDILEAASIKKIASLLGVDGKGFKEDEFDFHSFQSQHLPRVCEQLGISPTAVQSVRPCTPVQNGMLALFAHSQGNMYFNHMAFKSSIPLDRLLLKEAWSKVVARHEMLRTGFVQLHDQQNPFAMITYQKDCDIPCLETVDSTLTSLENLGRYILENLHQPPWRITIETSKNVTTLHFSALHSLYDAQTLQSILSDVESAYEGRELRRVIPIEATLGPILMASQKQSQHAGGFWQSLASEVQPSKFPDLHPVRNESKELRTSSIRCCRSLSALENRCQEMGVTIQAAGQAAWARQLAAYSGEQNVTFGTVFSGRNVSVAAQDAAFPCLVTVPLPLRIVGTNRELLDRTLRRNAALVKNHFTPLTQIQRWLACDEALFDTLFVYQKFATSPNHSRAWEIVDERTSIDYAVSVELIPHATELEIRISHRNDILPPEQAQILLNQYDRLLENTLFSPELRADDYSFLGHQLLSITPAKEKTIYSPISLLHQFVERNASRIPNKIAFEFAFASAAQKLEKRTWSYRHFNEDGNRVAHFLQSKGVLPGDIVAICFDKCPEASIAILGILKAGCAYLALDPTAPISRKRFIVNDSATKILLCDPARKAELDGLPNVEVSVLGDSDVFQRFSASSPVLPWDIQPGDTCYCLYTSGTTGTPKGCEITHHNAVQAMLAFQRLFSPHWDEDSRWLQFASFHFDVSVLEQYWSWSVGICVTSCPRDLLFEDLPGMIQKLQITHIDLTPSLAKLVHPDKVPSLCRGVFITGGEQLKQEILDSWGIHEVIYNGYGPTEVTIGCTMLPRMRANDKPSNIGAQFDNVGSYVFRPGTSIAVPRGGLGELCVSGALVGKGYLNRKELTEERFQTLPDYDDRIYRTGDLVRILYDGSFHFLGRIDDQIKLRGQRLEIGEINEIIKQAAREVSDAATLVLKHPMQAKDQLVSFITRSGTSRSTGDVQISMSNQDEVLLSAVKSACYTHLPGYMVPTHIIPLNYFPLSANNKADMKVLRSLYEKLSLEDVQNLTSMTVGRITKNGREGEIISVLAKFIGSAESAISPWSSIFELGLDSISVIAFSRRLKEAGFPNSQPSLIMKHPTVQGMALALRDPTTSSICVENTHKNAKQAMQAFAHKQFHFVCKSLGITDLEVEAVAPCTPLQEGIIYNFLSSSTPLYCSTFAFELDRSIDLGKLKSAWKQAQDQTQILRARLSPTPDGYAQVILQTDVLPWFHIVTSSDEFESSRKNQAGKWIARIHGLSTHLWEVGLITSSDKSMMCLNIFHCLYDGNSLFLLLELVARIYLGEQNASIETPEFLDVLHLGPLRKDPSAEEFWKQQLAKCPHPVLVNSESRSDEAIIQKMEISTTETLDYLRKCLNVTEQSVLHACWLLTLHRRYKFVPTSGIIASGRTIDAPGIADVIGPLFNTIPSNVQFHGLKTWSDVARCCHEYHVSTLPFQYTALRDIKKWLQKDPDEPLFDTVFAFQRENSTSTSLARKLWDLRESDAQHEYSLAFEITRIGNETLNVMLATKDHVMSPDEARQMLVDFERILREFSENPDLELPRINECAEEICLQTMNEVLLEPSGLVNSTEDPSSFPFHWTPQACKIRDAIADLSGLAAQSVSEKTSIFEVGLDSIDAIKLSSRLVKIGIKLPVSTIMRYRNVKAMISQVESDNHLETQNSYPRLDQLGRSLKEFLEKEKMLPPSVCRVLPATPIQEAMVAEMAASGYKHYYNHEVLRVEPGVNLKRLEEAWRNVVKSHPILRTSFVEIWDPAIPASYAQIVHSEDIFDLRTAHLDGVSLQSVLESQRDRVIKELASYPPLTVTIASDGGTHYVILSIAHALYDGWSIKLLHEDVTRCYNGETCTRPPPDAILEHILASSDDTALEFWRATLADCRPTPFPREASAERDSQVVHRAAATLPVSFGKAEAFCKQHGITIQALVVCCWSLVLATDSRSLDVTFGLVLSGRNMTESENIMFPTMNTVAMRVILHGTRVELIKYVQDTLLEISEYQHFPLRRARPAASSRALFDTLFIYQKRPVGDNPPAQPLYKSTGGVASVEYPVCAEVGAVGDSLIARVACREDIMGEKATLTLLDHMADVLLSIIDGPDQQTVSFSQDTMSISGYSVLQDTPKEVVAHDLSPRSSCGGEWLPIESKIRSVLSVVSGVPEAFIKKEDSIFQLGLDSISAIKVAALLKKTSVKLSVSDMVRAGTIERMSKAANSHHRSELSPQQVAGALEESLSGIDAVALTEFYGIDPCRIEQIIPATAGQTYFLAMHTLNPDIFYPQFRYLATSTLTRKNLSRAWACLMEEMPILRTTFLPTRDSHRHLYIQIVLNSVFNDVNWHEKLNDQEIFASSKRGLGSVPVSLHASQATEGTALVLQIHHALYDAVSLPYMIDRLGKLCNSTVSKPESRVGDISQLVATQQVYSPVRIRRLFWQKYLDSSTKLGISENSKGDFGIMQRYYQPGLVSNMSRLELAAKQNGLSVQSIFLALYARVQGSILVEKGADSQAIKEQLIVGLYLANRSLVTEGLSELNAPTVNIVPLRLDNKVGDSYRSLFEAAWHIQEEIHEISAIEHVNVSLLEIAEWTGVRISTCVNFLRLPASEEPSRMAVNDEVVFKLLGSDEIGDTTGSTKGSVTEGIQSPPNGNIASLPIATAEAIPRAASLTAIESVYLPTVDVEAAIRNDQLDFGLFGSNTRLSREIAERFMEELQRQLAVLLGQLESA